MTHQQDDNGLDLVRRAQEGDETAFEHLVHRFYGQVHRWATVRTGDPHDADDVTQDVLLRLHAQLHSFDGRSRFTTWLYQVTRSAAADLHRRRARRERLARKLAREPSTEHRQGETAERADRQRATDLVRMFFEGLSDRQREVFDLVDLQGFTPTEVGRMLGLEPVTVRSHLFRARKMIRKRILELHPELVEGYGP